MSTTGASTAISLGNNLRGRAQRGLKNSALGVGRFGARQTVGRGAQYASAGAERTRRSLDRGLGSLAQGGKWSQRTARSLDRTVGAGLRASEQVSVAGSETAAQKRTRINEQNAKLNATQQQTERRSTINQELARAVNNSDNESPEQRAARAEAINTIGNQVRRMSNDEVLNTDKETLESPEFAQHLTDSHISALRESGQYTNDQARSISKARDTGMINSTAKVLESTNASAAELGAAFDQLAQTIQNMPVERLATMDEGVLTSQRVASNLTETQLEGMKSSGRFTSQQITDIRSARETGLGNIAAGSAPEIVNPENEQHVQAIRDRGEKLFQGSAQFAGQLPTSVYTKKDMAALITPSALQQRVRNGMSDTNATTIEKNINEYLASRAATEQDKKAWRSWAEKSTEGARFNFTA